VSVDRLRFGIEFVDDDRAFVDQLQLVTSHDEEEMKGQLIPGVRGRR
jgi:hypothetical protein